MESCQHALISCTNRRFGSGHRPPIKGGYFPVPPVDSLSDLRAEMVTTIEDMGVEMEKHHHEVAPAQGELGIKFASLLQCAGPRAERRT